MSNSLFADVVALIVDSEKCMLRIVNVMGVVDLCGRKKMKINVNKMIVRNIYICRI